MSDTTPRLRRYAPLALATAGLVLASTGGAVAGAMVTGAQIKDGTVTSADVRNGSLAPGDLNATARSTYSRLQGYEHRRKSFTFLPGQVRNVELRCGAGRRVLHGSAAWVASYNAVRTSIRDDGTGIVVTDESTQTGFDDVMVLELVCATVSGGGAVIE